MLVSTQESGPTSAPCARRPSPSAAPWSHTWRRSTASHSRTPTRSAATSCTSARSAATRRERRTSCSNTSTRFTPTATCWKGSLPGELEAEELERGHLLMDLLRALLEAVIAMILLDRQSSRWAWEIIRVTNWRLGSGVVGALMKDGCAKQDWWRTLEGETQCIFVCVPVWIGVSL